MPTSEEVDTIANIYLRVVEEAQVSAEDFERLGALAHRSGFRLQSRQYGVPTSRRRPRSHRNDHAGTRGSALRRVANFCARRRHSVPDAGDVTQVSRQGWESNPKEPASYRRNFRPAPATAAARPSAGRRVTVRFTSGGITLQVHNKRPDSAVLRFGHLAHTNFALLSLALFMRLHFAAFLHGGGVGQIKLHGNRRATFILRGYFHRVSIKHFLK
jgi:hypothetical protein